MSHFSLNPKLVPQSTSKDYNRCHSFGDKDGDKQEPEQEIDRMTEHSKKTHEKLDFDQEEFNNVKQRMGKMLAAHAR
jgi:hypothetical protein